jgi:hypothetical protein
MKLYKVYTEILTEVGILDPSKVLPFRMTQDTVMDDNGIVTGKQFYEFKLPDGTEMVVELSYGSRAVVINFNSVEGAFKGKTPILGDSYKSAYVVINTVGAIVKHSLKDTLQYGETKNIVVYGKTEYGKKNPFQRQEMYNLFLQKAFPGSTIKNGGLVTVLPDNYEKYL